MASFQYMKSNMAFSKGQHNVTRGNMSLMKSSMVLMIVNRTFMKGSMDVRND